MRIKLSSVDILEITKALKGGWLDMDKVTGLKTLLDGYNPPKQITKDNCTIIVSAYIKD